MDIGYYIENGRICGPCGYTGYGVTNKNRIIGRSGDTRYWIYRGQIYSSRGGNTGYRVRGNRIHGPGGSPPWEKRSGRPVSLRQRVRPKEQGSPDDFIL